MKNNLYHIGYLIDTYKLHGQVKVVLEPWIVKFKLSKIKTLHLVTPNATKIVALSKTKAIKNYWIVKLDRINHINQIQAFKKAQLFVPESEYRFATTQWYLPNMIGYELVVANEIQGKLQNYFRQNNNIIGEFHNQTESFLIPMLSEYLRKKDDRNKIILGKKSILEIKEATSLKK